MLGAGQGAVTRPANFTQIDVIKTSPSTLAATVLGQGRDAAASEVINENVLF